MYTAPGRISRRAVNVRPPLPCKGLGDLPTGGASEPTSGCRTLCAPATLTFHTRTARRRSDELLLHFRTQAQAQKAPYSAEALPAPAATRRTRTSYGASGPEARVCPAGGRSRLRQTPQSHSDSATE